MRDVLGEELTILLTPTGSTINKNMLCFRSSAKRDPFYVPGTVLVPVLSRHRGVRDGKALETLRAVNVHAEILYRYQVLYSYMYFSILYVVP